MASQSVPASPGYAVGDEPGEMGAALPVVNVGDAGTLGHLVEGCHHTCVTLDGDRLKCWGYNAYGALGLGDTTTRDGRDGGPMGNALPVVDLGALGPIATLSAGCYHTCAMADAGLKCWGYNRSGELGQGDRLARGNRPGTMGNSLPLVALGTQSVIDVTSGGIQLASAHTCAILDGGDVKCWGANTMGQLGLGDQQPRGDDPMEMGDALPFVDLGPEE